MAVLSGSTPATPSGLPRGSELENDYVSDDDVWPTNTTSFFFLLKEFVQGLKFLKRDVSEAGSAPVFKVKMRLTWWAP